MGLSRVVQFLRAARDSLRVPEVQVAPSADGIPVTAEHYAPPGVDAPPLEGDTAAHIPGTGSGRLAVVGYMDTANEGVAAPGEFRVYSRSSAGEVMAYVWLQGDGTVDVRVGDDGASLTLKPSGDVVINGVTIDPSGNVSTPGDVTVMSSTAPVAVSTHLHPTAMGPSGSPTPGT